MTNEEFAAAYCLEDNRRVIAKALKAYERSLSEDDLLECGMVALWRTLQKHRPELGQKFTTSLYRFVNWECLNLVRRAKREKVVYLPEVVAEVVDNSSGIEEYLSRLTSADRDLVRWYYLEGHTIVEIGRRIGLSKEATRKRIGRAFQNLRDIARCMK